MSQMSVGNRRHACRYLGFSIISFVFLIVGTVIGGTAPQCTEYRQKPQFTVATTNYRPPQYCWTTKAFVPAASILGVVFAALTYTSLMQLAKTPPHKANTIHFQCLIVWGLSLCAIALILSFENAIFALLGKPKTKFECGPFARPEQHLCTVENGIWVLWVRGLAERSRGPHQLFIVASWWWVFYCVVSLVILSRLKYWCSTGCKKDCSHCVGHSVTGEQSDGCDSCVCCLFPPDEEEQVGIPLVAVSTIQPDLTINDCEVGLWLKKDVGLPQYFDNFAQNGYERMEALLYGINDESDLRQIVPEILPGHVILILKNLDLKRKGSMAFGSHHGGDTGGAVTAVTPSDAAQDEKA